MALFDYYFFGRLADKGGYASGLREHGHVAAFECQRGGVEALGQRAFQVGIKHAVLAGHNVPVGLHLPGGR